VLLAIALALRVIGLGEGLWFDEVKTWVRSVNLPIGQIVATFNDQNQHVLYSITAKLTTAWFGEGAVGLRLPAVGFGVAGLWAVYWFGRRLVSQREAFLATAILTFSYHHVWFSQNARGYTGLLFFSLLASGLLLRLLEDERRGYGLAIAYGAAVALAMYTHLTAAAVFAAHALVGLVVLWKRRASPGAANAAPIVWAGILAVTFSIQLYAFVLPQTAAVLLEPSVGGVSIEWKNPLWLLTEAVRGLGRGVPGGPIAIAAGATILMIGAVSVARRNLAAAAVMIVPVLITVGVIFALGHNLWPRFFFFGAGFAALLLVRGLFASAERLIPRSAPTWAGAAMALAVLASASTVPAAWGAKQDFVGTLEYVDRVRADGDAVVMLDMAILPYQEYWEVDWRIIRDAGELQAVEAQHERTWLVYTFPTSLTTLQPDVWARMQDSYLQAAEFSGTVAGGDVIVMVNR
jgi:4-amino-4-deoxy-L-arabinose transferase-like glycosyltransferase